MKLLNEGPYTTVKLTKEEVERFLTDPLFEYADLDKDDLEADWFITNDPNKDPEWDGRDKYWEQGKEYPYPYVVLIGESYYDSIAAFVLERNGLLKYFGE